MFGWYIGKAASHLSLEEAFEADRQTRWEIPEALQREQHARDERLSGERVVANRQQLAGSAEQHLLVRDKAGKPDGVDRGIAPHRRRCGGRRPGRRVQLGVVVELDDLCSWKVA